MTPSSDPKDLERRLTVMLNERAAAVGVESDADAVIARAVTAGERRSRWSWMLVAAAAVVMLSLGLVALGAIRDPDSAQTDGVLPAAPPPVGSVAATTPATVAPTTTPAVAEPVTGFPADGLVVVAANTRGPNSGLYLLSPGEAPRMIVGAAGDQVDQQCPHLSADGRSLAWGEGMPTAGGNPQRGVRPVVDRAVVVAPIAGDGTVSEPIVRVPVPDGSGEPVCPQWAPDGSAVAYRVDGDVWITDSVDGTTKVVDAGALFEAEKDPTRWWSLAEVAWSNDSSRIAASENGQLRIIDVATAASDVKDTGQSVPRDLFWLPGDQTILFATTDEPGDVMDIVVASVDGTDSGETILRSLPSPGANESKFFDSPELSPDGHHVAVFHSTATCDNEGCSAVRPRQILIVDLTTFAIATIPLPDERYVSTVRWSPDGRRLLLSSIDGVFSIPVNAEGPTTTFAGGADIDLEWTYDEITWQVPS
jgi:hypothetical protein